jgi:hypothetical protein
MLRAVMALPKTALPASARQVLTVLAWHCNELAVRRGDRRCRPSLNTISNETSLARTTCIRAIDLLEGRFVHVERHPRVANRYTLTDPKTWPVDRIRQSEAGSKTQPEADRVTLPGRVRELLHAFSKQVAPRDQPGRAVRPEQDFRSCEQEPPDIKMNAGREVAPKTPHRSQAEQLAYVAAMTKEQHK